MRQPRADRPGAGRRLPGAPRARLPRRLHAVAGAVAQAARRALGRARAVGGAAPRLRPRARDRDVRRAQEYWSIVATLATPDGDVFEARLVGADGKKIDAPRHRHAAPRREAFEARPRDLRPSRVASGRGEAGNAPSPPPFTTSTLQQEASRKLGFAPAQTMRVAQRLYEGVDIGGETVGLITYMRTDGIDMAPEAIAAARRVIAQRIRRALRARRAAPLHDQGQERAGSARGDPPDRPRRACPTTSRAHLDADQARLYELIWKRTDREPDGIGRARAHHRRHRRAQRRAAQPRPARHRPGHHASTAS